MTQESTDHLGRVRVAVTGMGVKSPAGNDLDTFWSTLQRAEATAAARISRWEPPADLSVPIACEVHDFDSEPYLGAKESRRTDRVAQLGFAAAVDALTQAGNVGADPARCGVVVGTGIGGLITLEEQVTLCADKGPTRVSPFLVPMMMANATAALVGMQHGWTGPNLCIATACAAGTHAIGEAARLIRDGSSDVVLAGGAESSITLTSIAAFGRMGALTGRTDDPTHASRPFDVDRDGFVMGEGAGFLVLERWDKAVARGATILGEVLGYGRNSDAHHITAPSPGGAGAAACMQLALDDAGLASVAIGHVNAHGTSTPLNDASEAEAITKVFGESAPPVTSTKGVTGHLVGAAGAVEAVATLLAIRDGVVPPTANHEQTDPQVTVDVVAGSVRTIGSKPVVSNSFGFGGHNGTLVLGGAS
ncbi:MAG TPA: beta-ketoacyl-ACP synthase II [Acidimicrobiales bacterium]|nr:beta-ketoacyl-ACP synthase II [Acidimicrobiales bacterium]